MPRRGQIKPPTDEEIRERMLAAGIRDAHQFGYPKVNRVNIMRDYVYGKFFESQLRQVLDDPTLREHEQIQRVAKSLFDEIIKERKPPK
jgi:hypothetical protein